MKTVLIKANDIIVERIVSLFELFPKDQNELSVLPYTEEEQALDELAKTIDFKDEEKA